MGFIAIKINFVILGNIVMQTFCRNVYLGTASEDDFKDPHNVIVSKITDNVQRGRVQITIPFN